MPGHHSNLLYRSILSFIVLSLCCQVFANSVNDCQESAQYQKNPFIYWPTNQYKQSVDQELWLTLTQAYSLLNDVMWIDVRSKLAQENNPLNILTIPLNQLEKKDFLHDETVVLIGTGFDQLVINKTINTLKKKGFKHLFSLSGGIRGWSKLKQQELTIPDEISPEEFLLGGETIAWQVITAGLTIKEINILPEKPVKTFSLSKKATLDLSNFLGNESTNKDAFIRYVLITPNQENTLFLKHQLDLSESNHIVFLTGGLANYQYYLKQQTNLINNLGQNLSKPCRLNF